MAEFKVVERAPDDDPLRQIQERGYAAKYRGRGVPIHQVGIRFSEEARNIVTFEAETIPV
ncbi:MAG: PD-(D/E)XK nuclease domain-containing protein [Propionibacteriaceae bacterium]|nr:PD-(D/E)XK nuclease domain-containing protein [Propionibacteriaceae bacterium]